MSGGSLPPYSGDDATCSKCGGATIATAWRAQDEARPGSWAQAVRDVPGQPERLERACGRCGYVWDEALAIVDASVPENDVMAAAVQRVEEILDAHRGTDWASCPETQEIDAAIAGIDTRRNAWKVALG